MSWIDTVIRGDKSVPRPQLERLAQQHERGVVAHVGGVLVDLVFGGCELEGEGLGPAVEPSASIQEQLLHLFVP